MTIKVGDRLPEGRLSESVEFDGAGCPINPQDLAVQDLAKGKKIVIFGLPGAYTPTCSAKTRAGLRREFRRAEKERR